MLQNRGDGADHPVLGPVRHAGGDGRVHSSEKGTLETACPGDVATEVPKELFLSSQWMFLQLNPLWDGPIKQLLADADAWLCKRRTGTTGPHKRGKLSFNKCNLGCLTCMQISWYPVFIQGVKVSGS